MQNIITVGRKHVPLEHIVLVEPFEPNANSDFRPDKDFKARLVLINRETLLIEAAPREFADAHGFPVLIEDNVATNPNITFRVESFEPTEDFKPTKPYLTRLKWRGQDGKEYSKLLVTKPEEVIAVALRGASSAFERKPPRRAAQRRGSRPRAALRVDQ
jgi:hypothetical protein